MSAASQQQPRNRTPRARVVAVAPGFDVVGSEFMKLEDQPLCLPANCSKRSRVSGNLRTSRTKAAACGLGLARPCSHFSSVRRLIRNLRAKTAREQRSLFRVSRISLEFTVGSGDGSTL